MNEAIETTLWDKLEMTCSSSSLQAPWPDLLEEPNLPVEVAANPHRKGPKILKGVSMSRSTENLLCLSHLTRFCLARCAVFFCLARCAVCCCLARCVVCCCLARFCLGIFFFLFGPCSCLAHVPVWPGYSVADLFFLPLWQEKRKESWSASREAASFLLPFLLPRFSSSFLLPPRSFLLLLPAPNLAAALACSCLHTKESSIQDRENKKEIHNSML